MATIQVNGAAIAYTAAGTGEPVVALHSSAGSGAQWRALRERIEDRFLVLAPDLYGYGATDPWPGHGPLTLADEAALVGALTAAACGGPFHLVGHSYGGAVALRFAVDHPEQLLSLTLVEPVAFHVLRGRRGADDRASFAEVCALADAVSAAVLSGDYAGGMARFVDYWNGAGAWAALRLEARGAMCRAATKIPLDFWATTTEQTSLDAYRRVQVPTLVLAGERSPASTRRIAGLLAASLPGARLEVIPGAGHMLPLTHRDAVNGAIAGHLARGGAGVRQQAA